VLPESVSAHWGHDAVVRGFPGSRGRVGTKDGGLAVEFLLALLAYLVGSIPVGLIVGRLVKGVDIRDYGSGNIGTTNAMRVLGGGWAAVVFIVDAAKGFVPVVVSLRAGIDPAAIALVAFLAVAGHNWPVYLGFRGGKGVATSLGVLLGISPATTLVALVVWVAVVLVSRYASLSSMLGLASTPLALYLFGLPVEFVVLGGVLFVTAVVRHHANIRRLLAGEELRFGQRVSTGEEGSQK